MTEPGATVAETGGRVSRGAGLRITLASVAGALSGYLVLAIVARTVDIEANSVFVTFWSALMTAYGALAGLNTETARSVAHADAPGRPSGAPVSGVLVVVPGLVAAIGLIAAFADLHPFGSSSRLLAVVVALSATAYAVEAVLLGALAGRGAWGGYAGVVGMEAGARVTLVAVTALAVGQMTGIAVATGAATGAWVLMLLLSRDVRAVWRTHLDERLPVFGRRAGLAVLAAATSSVMLVGFPVLVSLTTEAAVYASAAPLMLAIAVTRAPIMVPLMAFQSVIVSQFVRSGDAATRSIARVLLLLVGLGAVGAAAAWVVGSWLMELLFGEGYAVAGEVLAGLTFASSGIAVLTVTAALVQSFRQHVVLVTGWLAALAVSIGMLLLPLGIEVRVVSALLVGPCAGVLVHGAAILRRVRRMGTAGSPSGSPSDDRVVE